MTNKELQQQIEQLEQQIKDLKVKLESKVEKEPYEVKVPTDIEDYYSVDMFGEVDYLDYFSTDYGENCYIRGLAFETREEAEEYEKERILLFKMHKWAEKHSGGWIPDWEDWQERKYIVEHDTSSKELKTAFYVYLQPLTKLPYFKSEEIAKQFIEEFGEEIKEVLC